MITLKLTDLEEDLDYNVLTTSAATGRKITPVLNIGLRTERYKKRSNSLFACYLERVASDGNLVKQPLRETVNMQVLQWPSTPMDNNFTTVFII